MKDVCAITGATGGLGFGAAKKMGETHKLLISDINQEEVDQKVHELQRMGIEVEGMVVDVTDRSQVAAFANKAASMGEVQALVHLAGLTALFAKPAKIIKVNSIGTLNVNEEFYNVMEKGSCIMNICSSAAYMISDDRVPFDVFKISRTDKELFYNKMLEQVPSDVNESLQQGMAYTYSRRFIMWYVKDCCFKFGKKGIRVLSVSPGIIDTEMSKRDMEKSGNLDVTLSYCPLGRIGTVDEAAFLISVLVDKRNSYVNGVDILCDGGCHAAGYKGQRTVRDESKL